jgi:toxin ParE1/3/4
VATVRFSGCAKADLLHITKYTLRTWGEAQATRYLASMERCAKMLARNPALGRRCDSVRPGLHRFENGQHVLFYRLVSDGILVIRILHQRMLPDRQSFEPDQQSLEDDPQNS